MATSSDSNADTKSESATVRRSQPFVVQKKLAEGMIAWIHDAFDNVSVQLIRQQASLPYALSLRIRIYYGKEEFVFELMSNESEKRSGESLEEMLQHLEQAKQLDKTPSKRAHKGMASTKLQREIERRTDAAVLASNHEARLDEIAAKETVTHRSGKLWKSAKIGVKAHGRLPIYYRMNGEVTHTGYISRILLNPAENAAEAEEFVKYITDDDTYSEYHERLDTTTFLVTGGERLDEPFSQTELQKLSGKGPIEEDYSRQPAYVVQRSGDFPDFP